jgi:HAD superfamily hydrolase (TIGR01549 family)
LKYKHLIFDFDGVLVESNETRFDGFRLLFKNYPQDQVKRLVLYAKINGGLSRYEKIKYFFKQIRNEPIRDDTVQLLAKQYSELVKQKVIDAEPVKGSLEFLSNHKNNYDFAVVSGADQEELRDVCKAREIDHFFLEILGSPTSKESNIALLLSKMGWGRKSCLFIGDSINDFDAARAQGIDFIGRNSNLTNWGLMGNLTVVDDLSELEGYLKNGRKG